MARRTRTTVKKRLLKGPAVYCAARKPPTFRYRGSKMQLSVHANTG
jgi:hypothetical protein